MTDGEVEAKRASMPFMLPEAPEDFDYRAALAATVFHSGQIPIPKLKNSLAEAGIEVRPC